MSEFLRKRSNVEMPGYYYIELNRKRYDGLTNEQCSDLNHAAQLCKKIDDHSPINSEFIRNFHPLMQELDSVGVFDFPGEQTVWFSHDPRAGQERLYGGRVLHLVPRPVRPGRCFLPAPDPVLTLINPTKIQNDETIKVIQNLFKDCVDVRIYLAGAIHMVMPKADYDNYLEFGTYWPDTIGGLRCSLERQTLITPSSSSGSVAVGARAGALKSDKFYAATSALGVRLVLPDGRDVLTAATHGFVRMNVYPHPTSRNPINILRKLGHSLALTSAANYLARQPAVAWCVNQVADVYPVGKSVYFGLSTHLIGKITKRYDQPSPVLPYPAGYVHDLCLIADKEHQLPHMRTPKGFPKLRKQFGDPEEVLHGEPVLTMVHELQYAHFDEREKFKTLEGSVIGQGPLLEQIVDAASYNYVASSLGPQRSLLWRSIQTDLDSAEGASGSVLCVGKPTQEYVTAICFQNYQAPFPTPSAASLIPEHLAREGDELLHYKGGFLLPDEIRKSRIRINEVVRDASTWSGRHADAEVVGNRKSESMRIR
ncbi:hypothetical protein BJ508DRAFT_378403 [Ascobolus immersus RN42]|uniref:Uncharacterized protein n=1 Tax=Ascobolus immersus RN42 TaxID=1160509 RepID=A0A3N4HYP9_ASCIM|nr:hypothetical protein BJ508DRAFT_378403 [Ascobolus immersus RN42]